MAKDLKTPELNQDVANQMLKNIFDVCDITPNNVPTEDLESYTEYREDKFRSKRILLVAILIVFLCIPIFFIGPRVTQINQSGNGTYPKYSMQVESVLPILSVKASIDGKKVNVYEVKSKTYSIEPDMSGSMIVKVQSINGQYTTHKIQVDPLDNKAPKILGNKVGDGTVTLNLSDEETGIDYDNVFMMNDAGEKIFPVSHSEENGTVTFRIPSTSTNIFIPDKAGNVLQLALTLE